MILLVLGVSNKKKDSNSEMIMNIIVAPCIS